MIRLEDVYGPGGEPREEAVALLYQLLAERPARANISHRHLPVFEDHQAFVRSRPYRAWFIATTEGVPVGAVYATPRNEIGVAILKTYHRRGYGEAAVLKLIGHLLPLPASPSMHCGSFVAHVSPDNEPSHAFFEKLGGRLIQLTYELPRGD